MRRHLWAVVSVGLLVLGSGLFLTSASANDVGWFAYTPIDNQVRFPGDVVFLTRERLLGCVVAVLGLTILAAGIGYRVGQRRGSSAGL